MAALLRLGFLIDFISVPVIAGFTSAAALTIATSQVSVRSPSEEISSSSSPAQVKSLLGLTIPPDHKSHLHLGVIDSWVDVFTHITTCRSILASHWSRAPILVSVIGLQPQY